MDVLVTQGLGWNRGDFSLSLSQVASYFNSFIGVALVCDLRIQGEEKEEDMNVK